MKNVGPEETANEAQPVHPGKDKAATDFLLQTILPDFRGGLEVGFSVLCQPMGQ